MGKKSRQVLMVEPRTIDNLGLEPSVRWARDQEYLDKTLIKESPFVSQQTKVDVSYPFFLGECDLLFQINDRYKPWAVFLPPKGYNDQRMRLFTHQAIPSLGTEEFQQTQIKKIQDKSEKLKKSKGKKRKKKKGQASNWEQEKEEEDAQATSKILLTLLEYVRALDELVAIVNAKRSQYSKG